MGKYLQNIEFRFDDCVKKAGLLQEARMLSEDLNAIEFQFNHYLPKKIEIGNQIWRFIIWLTPVETKNGKTELVGLCQDYYAFLDFKNILQMNTEDRTKVLLEIFITGIDKCCEINSYSNSIFRLIYDKMKIA